jgi:ubiquinone/menaquinone biosynthesis C-methylase UbiE
VDRLEFFCRLPRCEPGGATFTSAYLTHFPIKAHDVVLDLGCGSGDRATWIARSRGCKVVAVDRDARYLEYVQQRAEEGGASNLVLPVTADYGQLPFADASFKYVLAEGAAWPLGLKQALTVWRRVLVPQGLLAVTYPGVVNKDATPQVREPLEQRMAEPLGTLASYHQEARAAGFEVIHQVSLQHELWDAYYTDNIRHAWALSASGEVPEDDPALTEVLDEARWFRRVGRGRVFVQALVLKRVR